MESPDERTLVQSEEKSEISPKKPPLVPTKADAFSGGGSTPVPSPSKPIAILKSGLWIAFWVGLTATALLIWPEQMYNVLDGIWKFSMDVVKLGGANMIYQGLIACGLIAGYGFSLSVVYNTIGELLPWSNPTPLKERAKTILKSGLWVSLWIGLTAAALLVWPEQMYNVLDGIWTFSMDVVKLAGPNMIYQGIIASALIAVYGFTTSVTYNTIAELGRSLTAYVGELEIVKSCVEKLKSFCCCKKDDAIELDKRDSSSAGNGMGISADTPPPAAEAKNFKSPLTPTSGSTTFSRAVPQQNSCSIM